MTFIDPKKPIVVPRLPWLEWLGQLVRAGVMVATGVVAGIALTQFREGVFTTLTLTTLAGVFTTGYAGFKTWLKNEKMKRLAEHTPDAVGQVKR